MSDIDSSEDDACWSDSDTDEDQSGPGSWKYISSDELRVQVDDVDMLLLEKAREEADYVAQRLLQRMFGTTQHHSSSVSVSRLLLTWLDSSVLSKLQRFVNANLAESAAATTDDLLQFLEVELWLSFYGVTPMCFYNSNNLEQYPPARSAMSYARYSSILSAFGPSRDRQQSGSSREWTAPFSPDRDTTHAAELIRRLCADIGFVAGTTIASLDDDLIRLRSSRVNDVGLAHVRNPKKGFGPVQHGVVSLVTGLFLGGHIAARGESTVDIVRIIQRSLCGASTESQIRLPGIVHALDRGYQSNAVNQQIADVGGSIIGTHKRIGRFPFTFGKQPSQHQQLVSEKGEKAAYWASKRLRTSTGTLPVHAHALAYRSGLGKIALGFTTMQDAGPGCWTYVTRPSTQSNFCGLFDAFEANVQLLTATQRTPDWFLLRKFRITGSVAAKIFKAIAGCGDFGAQDATTEIPAADPDVEIIVLLLSFQQPSQLARRSNESSNEGARSSEPSFSKEELGQKTCEELKLLCRDAMLPVSGRKSELIDRLFGAIETVSDHGAANRNPRVIVEKAFLAAWFMAPFSTTDTKIGTANEDNIAAHITPFLDKYTGYHIEQLKSYGLICRKDMPVAAFSPDNIASVLNVGRGRFNAVMEYKTRTTARTVQRERTLVSSCGAFTTVEMLTMGFGGRLSTVIPEPSHRLQMLHSIVCGGVQDGFLVYASATSIIRVIHLVVGHGVSWTYRAALKAIQKGYMGWIYNDISVIPRFDSNQLGHCVDQATLEQTFMLWKELVKLINDRGQPLPSAKHIMPTLIALWNRMKGGIDVYSRYLKNVQSKHSRLSPTATIWLRMLMSLIYNAYQSFLLLQSHSFLMNRSLCTFYKAYQTHRQHLPSFAAFCRDAAVALLQRPRAATPLSTVSENIISSGSIEMGPSFVYNKRQNFETEKEWIDLRLSKLTQHHSVRIDGALQLSCILCCRRNHDTENHGHSRQGYKTSFECIVCKVALCRTKRWGGDQSCFDKFHAERNLPDPCKHPQEQTSTKPNENRAPPPSRKRSTSLDPPNQRAPSLRLSSKKRRRSLRLSAIGSRPL